MYSKIGNKIKNFTMIISAVGIILAFLTGLGIIMSDDDLVFLGIIIMIMIICTILFWISGFVLYGFGELIERLISIDNNLIKYISYKEPHQKKTQQDFLSKKDIDAMEDKQNKLKNPD